MKIKDAPEGSIFINMAAKNYRLAPYEVINGKWARPPTHRINALVKFLKKASKGPNNVTEADIQRLMFSLGGKGGKEDAVLLTGVRSVYSELEKDCEM